MITCPPASPKAVSGKAPPYVKSSIVYRLLHLFANGIFPAMDVFLADEDGN